MRFGSFSDEHAATLEAVFNGPDWRGTVAVGAVTAARDALITPPATRNVFKLPAEQLVRMNGERVRGMIAAGETDEEGLLAALGSWPERWPADVPVILSFLGLNLDFGCDMQPRCMYCNQRPTERRMRLEDWKAVVRSVTSAEGEGPYIFITGGEPLLLGESLWGADGLVRYATGLGAGCNVNTNALALTPRAALGLVSAGLSRAHISLDTHVPERQDVICRRQGRWAQVARGIHNLQIAKELLGVEHPVIHVNCVLNRRTAWDFPGFLAFLLHMKPLVAEGVSRDFDLHLIPVGGERNRHLRLGADEYERFFTEVWPAADMVWGEYQAIRGIPEDKRGPLHKKLPFLSPYHRAQQRGSLSDWARQAAAGTPAALAVTERCYVGPTQAFVLPDGAQYWCGGHATSRPEPVGNVLEDTVLENTQRGLAEMALLPASQCRSCPGATQAINQAVETSLRETIAQWLKGEDTEEAGEQADAADEYAFE